MVIQYHGLDYVLSEYPHEKIDQYDGVSTVTGKPYHYDFLAGWRLLLVVEDHSKHSRHALLCPVADDEGVVMTRWSQAAAWTFPDQNGKGMSEEEYLKTIKEGES